jgi:hypothetical protein
VSTQEPSTIIPATTPGVYKLTDGRVRRFTWIAGQLVAGPIYASHIELYRDERAKCAELERLRSLDLKFFVIYTEPMRGGNVPRTINVKVPVGQSLEQVLQSHDITLEQLVDVYEGWHESVFASHDWRKPF